MVIKRRLELKPAVRKLFGPAEYATMQKLSYTMHRMMYRHLMFAVRRFSTKENVAIYVLLDLYVFAAYCYYHLDEPIMSDGTFDALATHLEKNWRLAGRAAKIRNIPVTLGDVTSGTFLGEYPRSVLLWGVIHLEALKEEKNNEQA